MLSTRNSPCGCTSRTHRSASTPHGGNHMGYIVLPGPLAVCDLAEGTGLPPLRHVRRPAVWVRTTTVRSTPQAAPRPRCRSVRTCPPTCVRSWAPRRVVPEWDDTTEDERFKLRALVQPTSLTTGLRTRTDPRPEGRGSAARRSRRSARRATLVLLDDDRLAPRGRRLPSHQRPRRRTVSL